jgi:hypothetical protein
MFDGMAKQTSLLKINPAGKINNPTFVVLTVIALYV